MGLTRVLLFPGLKTVIDVDHKLFEAGLRKYSSATRALESRRTSSADAVGAGDFSTTSGRTGGYFAVVVDLP